MENIKSKLAKTPYLVLFIVLIAVGVGTASALITITLAGNVIVTGDLDMTGGDLSIENPGNEARILLGTNDPGNNDVIVFDDGSKILMWDESENNFFVNDELIASPIVGSWSPNSSTSNSATDFVKWDIEEENTNSNYYGFIAGSDSIQIKKSGYYRVTAHVSYTSISDGENIIWEIQRTNSAGSFQEHLCQVFQIASGIGYSGGCSAIEFINENDRIKLSDQTSTGAIFGDSDFEDFTFLNIERLN